MTGIQKWLIGIGLLLVALGLTWPLWRKIGLGRLPGDFHFGSDGFSVHILLGTSILLSVVLTVLLNLFLHLFHK